MTIPRIFISSTCYDLQEIRFQLRKFIEDVGYEPIMSEFGDIFYDLNQHVQDSCKDAISRSNMFILIIGNSYGSIYHKHSETTSVPDSITLQEFKKALSVGVPKFIFINRFVRHDFENYQRAFSKYETEFFLTNQIDDHDIEKEKQNLKIKFDKEYPFPQDAYKFIFYFLDEIYKLEMNNAIFPFESFDHIKDNLRKQWAGFFYESLTQENNISTDIVEKLDAKLERIEHKLKLLTDGITSRENNQTISIDISKLAKELDIKNLEEIQDKINNDLNALIYDEDPFGGTEEHIRFNDFVTLEKIVKWLTSLGAIIQKYKWSKHIPASVIFETFSFILKYDDYDIPNKLIFDLYSIANNLEKEDKKSLATTIATKFNEVYSEEVPSPRLSGDDVPF